MHQDQPELHRQHSPHLLCPFHSLLRSIRSLPFRSSLTVPSLRFRSLPFRCSSTVPSLRCPHCSASPLLSGTTWSGWSEGRPAFDCPQPGDSLIHHHCCFPLGNKKSFSIFPRGPKKSQGVLRPPGIPEALEEDEREGRERSREGILRLPCRSLRPILSFDQKRFCKEGIEYDCCMPVLRF